jgi:hypothetical protein
MCTEVNINRVSLVARHKPVPIRLSEYYEPSKFVDIELVWYIDSMFSIELKIKGIADTVRFGLFHTLNYI